MKDIIQTVKIVNHAGVSSIKDGRSLMLIQR